MTCRQVRRQLLAWVEGELDESQWLSLVQHMEVCELCRAEAQRWQRLVAVLRAIAQSDGIPPVPNRLWHRLRTHRRRLPAAVSLFVTACVAFFLGWGVRGIAMPFVPPQNAAVAGRGTRDEGREKAGGQVGKGMGVQGLGLSLCVVPSPSQRSTPLRVRPVTFAGANNFDRSSSPSFSHWRFDNPLALSGAAAMALGVGHKRPLCLPSLHPCFAADLPTDEFALDSAGAMGQGVDAHQVADEPYRIFVQVTDAQGQVVRTVSVNKSEPSHVVAEWHEIRQAKKPQTEVSDDAPVLAAVHDAVPDRGDGGGAR
ncbi:MAG: hypothetical protein LKKZDAJK_001935 [Candidatus Fervidibacter sp.]